MSAHGFLSSLRCLAVRECVSTALELQRRVTLLLETSGDSSIFAVCGIAETMNEGNKGSKMGSSIEGVMARSAQHEKIYC